MFRLAVWMRHLMLRRTGWNKRGMEGVIVKQIASFTNHCLFKVCAGILDQPKLSCLRIFPGIKRYEDSKKAKEYSLCYYLDVRLVLDILKYLFPFTLTHHSFSSGTLTPYPWAQSDANTCIEIELD